MNKGRKEACSESFLHCFSYALCSAYGDREASKLISTIVGVFEACDSLVLMHRDLKPDNLLFHSVQKHLQIGPKLLCPSIPALVCHVKVVQSYQLRM
jgi:serine/threonine protein kinase